MHDEAPSFEATDWQQIVALYDVLRVVAPSPLVHLNRARGGRQGPRAVAGLELLNELADVAELRLYYLLPSAGARVLEDLGRLCEVPDAYRLALDLVVTMSNGLPRGPSDAVEVRRTGRRM